MATMNDCKTFQPLLAEYVDGELADKKAWEVKLHLASCAVCTRIADDFRATARLVSSLPEPSGPSLNFEAMLAARIADQCLKPVPASPWSRFQAWWGGVVPAMPARAFAPTLATVALAAVIALPMTYVATRTKTQTKVRTDVPTTTGVPSKANLVESDSEMSELYNDHVAFAAAQPLGDPATALSAAPARDSKR